MPFAPRCQGGYEQRFWWNSLHWIYVKISLFFVFQFSDLAIVFSELQEDPWWDSRLLFHLIIRCTYLGQKGGTRGFSPSAGVEQAPPYVLWEWTHRLMHTCIITEFNYGWRPPSTSQIRRCFTCIAFSFSNSSVLKIVLGVLGIKSRASCVLGKRPTLSPTAAASATSPFSARKHQSSLHPLLNLAVPRWACPSPGHEPMGGHSLSTNALAVFRNQAQGQRVPAGGLAGIWPFVWPREHQTGVSNNKFSNFCSFLETSFLSY